MNWLDNLKISIKLFIAPVFLFVVILGMWLSTALIFSAEKHTLQVLKSQAFAEASATQSLNVTVNRIHGNMFRILTWDSNGINSAQVDGLLEQLVSDLNLATEYLEAMKASKTDALIAAFEAYSSDVGEFEKAFNFGRALNVISKVDKAYNLLTPELASVSDVTSKSAGENFAQAEQRLSTATKAYTIAVIIAILVAVFVTVTISRRIANALTRTSQNIEKIAAGDYTSEFQDAGRRDEVGQMVRALEILQDKSQSAKRCKLSKTSRPKKLPRGICSCRAPLLILILLSVKHWSLLNTILPSCATRLTRLTDLHKKRRHIRPRQNRAFSKFQKT